MMVGATEARSLLAVPELLMACPPRTYAGSAYMDQGVIVDPEGLDRKRKTAFERLSFGAKRDRNVTSAESSRACDHCKKLNAMDNSTSVRLEVLWTIGHVHGTRCTHQRPLARSHGTRPHRLAWPGPLQLLLQT
jgi:hypothetical protein